MKRFQFSIILIGFLCIPPISGQSTCPTGKPSTQDCSKSKCPSASICYRKANKPFCCGDLDLFCPTKMHALHSYNSDSESYSWGPVKPTDKKKWYNVKLGNETIGCPFPFSFTYKEYKDLLPVDFDAKRSESSKPKKCKANSDCNKDNDEFCGAATHPTYLYSLDKSGNNGAPLRFCYKFQDFGFANIKPVIKADGKELVGCKSNSDCSPSHGAEAFCFIKNTTIDLHVAKENFKNKEEAFQDFKGFCAVANVCQLKKHGSIIASLTKNSTFCKTNDDCKGSANAKKHPGMTPECVATSISSEANMCCYKHNKDCQYGNIEYPFKNCDNFDNCNSGGGLVANKWCDEKNQQCCEDPEDKLWACPDGATPLFNEPKCNDVSALVIESGTCPNPVGICRNGHCCPKLTKNGNEFLMGEKAYKTNVACKPHEAVPQQFNHAFCDPENKTIVIIGSTDADEEVIAESGTNCTTNTECKEEEVCLKRTNNDQYCLWNPLNKKPVIILPDSKLWKYMLIGSLSGALAFFVAAAIFSICYYKHSLVMEVIQKVEDFDENIGSDKSTSTLSSLPEILCPYPPTKGTREWELFKRSAEHKRRIALDQELFSQLSDEMQQLILRSLEEVKTGTPIEANDVRFETPDWLKVAWTLEEPPKKTQ